MFLSQPAIQCEGASRENRSEKLESGTQEDASGHHKASPSSPGKMVFIFVSTAVEELASLPRRLFHELESNYLLQSGDISHPESQAALEGSAGYQI